MKDTEFIELLNLYLDSEISPTDASRLEAEVQRNPDRYRVYQQYCRMQKACTLLAADFTSDVPAVVALKAEGRRSAAPNFYAIAGIMAAAACVAFVFMNRSTVPTPAGESSIAAKPAVATLAVAPAAPETARTIAPTVTTRRPEFQAVLRTSDLVAENLTGNPETQQDERFNWIDNTKFSALPRMEVVRFETPRTLKPSPRIYSSGPMQDPRGESASWQFQK